MKTTIAALFLFVIFAATATAQKTADPAEGFYRLTKAAPHAFNNGDHEQAKAIAMQLLQEAPRWEKNWNYGNALHVANLVLGRVALAAGDIDEAGKFLLEAGRTPGSPQLNSFGPDMLFASEMLKKDQVDIVVRYFDLCEKFWTKRSEQLAGWKEQVKRGETPDFGPNVRYHF